MHCSCAGQWKQADADPGHGFAINTAAAFRARKYGGSAQHTGFYRLGDRHQQYRGDLGTKPGSESSRRLHQQRHRPYRPRVLRYCRQRQHDLYCANVAHGQPVRDRDHGHGQRQQHDRAGAGQRPRRSHHFPDGHAEYRSRCGSAVHSKCRRNHEPGGELVPSCREWRCGFRPVRYGSG